MVRNKSLTLPRFKQFGRLSAGDKQDIASKPNSEFEPRREAAEKRRIWTERGIALSELAPTSILATINSRGWDHYARTPQCYHPDLVREFYASMVPEVFDTFGTVIVQNRRVEITIDAINEYLHTTPAPETAFIRGLTQHDYFTGIDGRLAASLRRNGSDLWIPNEVDLLYEELHLELALWTGFIKHNLRPSSHRTVTAPEVARCLFSIQHHLPINVGLMIHLQILNAGRGTTGILPFPCLITHFCGKAGIDMAKNDQALRPPQSDIGRKAYNAIALAAHLPGLPIGRQVRPRQRTTIVADEDKEGATADMVEVTATDMPSILAPPPRSTSNRPPWVDEIIGSIGHLAARMDTLTTTLSEQVTDLNTRVTSLEDAMRDRGFGQGYIRKRRRGPTK